jgi:hypothetical protein
MYPQGSDLVSSEKNGCINLLTVSNMFLKDSFLANWDDNSKVMGNYQFSICILVPFMQLPKETKDTFCRHFNLPVS